MTNIRKRNMTWQVRKQRTKNVKIDRNNRKSRRFKIMNKMILIFKKEKRRLKKRKKLKRFKKKMKQKKIKSIFFLFFLQFFFSVFFFLSRVSRSSAHFTFVFCDRNCMCWDSSFKISCQFIFHSINIVFMKSLIIFSSSVISLASRSTLWSFDSSTELILISYKSINFYIVVRAVCLSLMFKKNVNKIDHFDKMSSTHIFSSSDFFFQLDSNRFLTCCSRIYACFMILNTSKEEIHIKW